MAFQFSLATVLRVRGIVEDREERMLQRIVQEISQTMQAVADTDTGIQQFNVSRTASVYKTAAGINVHASYGEMERLKSNRAELEGQLDKLESLRERQMQVYGAARRNREMLTDMRAERRDAYDFVQARREQSGLDDNFIARRGRAA